MVNDLSYGKYNRFDLSLNINLKIVGIMLFVLFFSMLKSFIPFNIVTLLLITSIATLLFSSLVINKKGIFITKIDIMWILFLLIFIMNITYNNLISKSTLFDIFVYTSGILFLLLIKVDISFYKYPLRTIKALGIVYACSAIFQYLYIDIYLNHILPLFATYDQDSIITLLRNDSYSGFTSQTAHLAGYTVNAIGVIIFSNWNVKLSKKFISIIFIIILFAGLLLSAKRAHLIFMIVAILITSIASLNNKKIINNVMRLTASLLIVAMLAIALYNVINFKEDSPVVNFVNELEYTFIGIVEGDDVTSGRNVLYKQAWEWFKENPVIGIGWNEFINNSLGLIRSDIGSHPHNIYLQLLTELGILGFIFFMFPVLYLYHKSFRLLRFISEENNVLQKWKSGIKFSFFSQTFFLLYGLTGNLITDYNFLLWYFFACSISLSAIIMIKRNTLIGLTNK